MTAQQSSEKLHFGTDLSVVNLSKTYANSAEERKSWGLILAVGFMEWLIHKSCDSGWRETRALEINKEDCKTLNCAYILKQTKPKSFPVRLYYHCPMKSY